MNPSLYNPLVEIADHYLTEIADSWCEYYTKRDTLPKESVTKLRHSLTEKFKEINVMKTNIIWNDSVTKENIIALVQEAITYQLEKSGDCFYALEGSLETIGLESDDDDGHYDACDKQNGLIQLIIKSASVYVTSGVIKYYSLDTNISDSGPSMNLAKGIQAAQFVMALKEILLVKSLDDSELQLVKEQANPENLKMLNLMAEKDSNEIIRNRTREILKRII